MSYDIIVFGSRSLPTADTEAIVEAIPSLAMGEFAGDEFTVVRGKRRAYAFTVCGPNPVGADDVPSGVLHYVLDPCFVAGGHRGKQQRADHRGRSRRPTARL